MQSNTSVPSSRQQPICLPARLHSHPNIHPQISMTSRHYLGSSVLNIFRHELLEIRTRGISLTGLSFKTKNPRGVAFFFGLSKQQESQQPQHQTVMYFIEGHPNNSILMPAFYYPHNLNPYHGLPSNLITPTFSAPNNKPLLPEEILNLIFDKSYAPESHRLIKTHSGGR